MQFRRPDRTRPSAARLSVAVRTVVEALEARQLLSAAPELQPARFAVRDDELAFFADFGDADAGEHHSVTADWGDGSTVELLSLDEPGTFSAAGSVLGTAYGRHRYASTGARTVTLTLLDAGGHTVTQQFTALVGQSDDEPAVGPTAPYSNTFASDGGDALTSDTDEPATAEAGEPDVTPPAVQAVYVSSSAPWSANYLNHLQANNLGSAAYGFAVPAGAHQTDPLPWLNLDRITVQFTEDVLVEAGDLALYGVNTATYSLAASNPFSYDPNSFTATWTLAAALPADRLLIDLDGNTADGVTDVEGNPLDGRWSNADDAQTFPGGAQSPGSDFAFRFDVMPGDGDRNGHVDAFDTLTAKAKEGSNTTTNTTNYSPWYDVDGNGRIDAFDTLGIRAKQGTALPAGTTPGVPATPSDLTATASGLDIDLEWPAVAGADAYDLYRGANGAELELYRFGLDGTTFSDAELPEDTLFTYAVAAVNAGLEGPASSGASAHTGPAAPQDPQAAVESDTELDLTWVDASAAEQRFVVERTGEDFAGWSAVADVPAGTAHFEDTGLSPDTAYYYRVGAVGTGGVTTYSDVTGQRTLPTPPPPEQTPPPPDASTAALTATSGDGSVTLSWSAVAGAASYNVYMASTTGGEGTTPLVTDVGGTSWTVTDLTNDVTYYFVVTAVGPGGEGARSNEAWATPRATSLQNLAPVASSVAAWTDGWTQTGTVDSRVTSSKRPRISAGDNDGDRIAESVKLVLVTVPAHGMVQLFDDGNWVYYPDESWLNGPDGNGTQIDHFVFKLNDGTSDSNLASVVLTGRMESLWADDNFYQVNSSDGVLDLRTEVSHPLLYNDSRIDGWTQGTAELDTGPSNGTVEVFPDGAFRYARNADFVGIDTFTYRRTLRGKASNAARVYLLVNPNGLQRDLTPADVGPVLNGYGLSRDYWNTTAGLMDFGVELSTSLTVPDRFDLASGSSLGAAVSIPEPYQGKALYAAPGNVAGWDHFDYTATAEDGHTSAPGRMWMLLRDDGRYPGNTSGATPRDTALTGTLSKTPWPASTLALFHLKAGPRHGSLALDPTAGQYTYRPAGGYVGPDSFTYYGTDTAGWDSALGTVFLTVTPPAGTPNPPPPNPPKVDLDVDSLNNEGFDLLSGSRTEAEDSVEMDAPGKLIAVNDDDSDGDGIPDFADGFGQPDLPNDTRFQTTPGERFVPLSLETDGDIDLSKATFSFQYSDSHPRADVYRDAADGLWKSHGDGSLRIWTKPGDAARNGDSLVVAQGTPGDFVMSGATYSAAQLGFGGSKMFYVEAIQPGTQTITVAVDPDGAAGPLAPISDAVCLTAYSGLIRMDANRDGVVSFAPSTTDAANSDRTTGATPYRFWLNDDVDEVVHNKDDGNAEDQQDVPRSDHGIDSLRRRLVTERDLEDFTRVTIHAPPIARQGGWTARLSLEGSSTLAANVLVLDSQDEANTYLTDPATATALVGKTRHRMRVGPPLAYDVEIPDGGEVNLLLEGAGAGSGKLKVTFDVGGTVVAEDSTDLDLKPVERMYEHWTVGDTPKWGKGGDLRLPGTPLIPLQASQVTDTGDVTDRDRLANQYILFVHGWRMTPWERRAFASTAYKRLYWQGYRGQFGMFSWPTDWVDTTSYAQMAWQPHNFDRSEHIAWHSAPALRSLLKDLDSRYGAQNVHLVAHSMGNITASEALRLEASEPNPQTLVGTYIASQAAVAAEAYDSSVPENLFDGKDAMWGPRRGSLNIYDDFPATRLAYFQNIGVAADRIFNFFNPLDYATGMPWRVNQRMKPDQGYDWEDPWGANNAGFYRLNWLGGPSTLLDLNVARDRYEAFAFAAEPRSYALGDTFVDENAWGQGGAFAKTNRIKPGTNYSQVDLQRLNPDRLDDPINFTKREWDHSAQFNGTYMIRRHYWNLLLKRMGILQD